MSLYPDDLDDLVSLDTLELLESCGSFDFFESKLPLLDTLLLLLDENFDDLTPWAASLSQQCTFFLKEHTWVSTSNQSSSLLLSSTSWRGHWIASSSLPEQLWSYWKTVSPQWCYTFWSICHWSPSPLSEGLFLLRQIFLSNVSRFSCSTSITMLNDVFPCTLFNPLWARTVIRHTRCFSDLGPSFTMLILIDHHWLHLVIPFKFLFSVSGFPRSVSNLSPSDILPTRLTKFSSFIYYFCVTAQ